MVYGGNMLKDDLGTRMKEYYENRSKTYLTRRTPCIVRIDGKACHTFCRNLKKPWDEIFHMAMDATVKYLCENIQGCKLGYTQSDEISLLLTDYDTLVTDAYFGYSVQKICSITASMATLEFNKVFREEVTKYQPKFNESEEQKYYYTLVSCVNKGLMFDSRCFSIPKEEVTNYFVWRQKDASRNAVQMLGQNYFSHKELQGKKCNDIQDMLMTQHNVNFNDMSIPFKRGTCCIYVTNKGWILDTNIPIFTQDREYIDKLVFLNEEE